MESGDHLEEQFKRAKRRQQAQHHYGYDDRDAEGKHGKTRGKYRQQDFIDEDDWQGLEE